MLDSSRPMLPPDSSNTLESEYGNATAGVRSIDGYDGGLWVTRPWVGAR